MSETNHMAAQLAQLLTGSSRDELEEALRRWKEGAGTASQRRIMEQMAEQILALRTALDQAPTPPSREELQLALEMMLRVAAGSPSST